MPVAAARSISVTAAEHKRLKKVAWSHRSEYRARVRAQIVLLAVRGWANARIARQVGVHLDTVRMWRGRFAEQRLAGLADRGRSGRPSAFTLLQRAQVTALACRLPAEDGVPLARWSAPELAREATGRGIATFVPASTIRRWLRADALKPWQYRSWIFITDPLFRPRAQRVLDLYARTFDGVELGEDEYVISADEKTSIQARCHPTLAPGQACAIRVNHTYGRGGALAYLAAYDVHWAKVFGRTEPRTGIDPFMNLVTQVMSQEPYASARRVFWVVDNGSSHRGQTAADRLTAAFPNAVMVRTPVHASWLNQVETYFSAVQRKVFTPNDFTDLAQVGDRLRAFEDRYNATAQPFQWKFTPPTWTNCWPGSTGTPPITRRNPRSVSPRDQPPKDFRSLLALIHRRGSGSDLVPVSSRFQVGGWAGAGCSR
ncbi:IS630 family transposase, partial [Streptomyces sp. NPDC056638]|uniref:IS630 family transposase n=1 Tax=Streptomyces sp. NPDC056638 TaxID=3345887 RepID=UPI0036B028D3